MQEEIQERYKALLEHYGNKYTDFDLFFQNYEGLFVFSRIDIVNNVLNLLLEQKLIDQSQTFIETGSGDGRIVALASIFGFRTFGLELSNDMNNIALDHIDKLVNKSIIKNKPQACQGDFLNLETYKKLKCKFEDIDIFFNYYTNTEHLAKLISTNAKPGAIMISVSLSKRPVNCGIELIYNSSLPDRNHYLFVYKKSI